MNLIAAGIAALLAANPAVVSHIDDSRIVESSSLAYSAKYPDLAYTMNDSGHRPIVFAIKVSTGRVVGQTDLDAFHLKDPESLAVDPRGRLWLGDLGDNDGERDDVSIVAFDEPGPGNAPPRAVQRFPVSYPNGHMNVEAMMVYPTTSQVFLINKTESGNATLFALPQTLRNGQRNEAVNLRRPMPVGVSDASFTPDGRHALVETGTVIRTYDVQTWEPAGQFETPHLQQAESLTVEPGGRSILLGSEGKDSPLLRVALPAYAVTAIQPSATPTGGTSTGGTSTAAVPAGELTGPNVTPAKPEPVGTSAMVALGGLLAVAAGILVARFVQRRRRLLRRHRRIDERHRV
jgi:hypothetical protein